MARAERFQRVEDAYSRHAKDMERVESSVLLILLAAAVGILLTVDWSVWPW